MNTTISSFYHHGTLTDCRLCLDDRTGHHVVTLQPPVTADEDPGRTWRFNTEQEARTKYDKVVSEIKTRS